MNEVVIGDCVDVMRAMPDESVHAIVTDPPYGISYASARRKREDRLGGIKGDEEPHVDWIPEAYDTLRSGGVLLCFCRWDVQEAFKTAIESAGFELRSQVIWDRGVHGLGDLKAQFAPRHDVIWFATKGAFEFPGKRPVSVLRETRVDPKALVHPTQKPVKLMERLISAVVSEGVVLDPFAGSGSSGVAARRLGLGFVGIELDPSYAEIAKRRVSEAVPRQSLMDFI